MACNSTFLLLVKVFITFCILSSPGYELYVICADSQPKSVGLVWGLAATRRSVCIHQMNQVNSRSDHGHEDSTINIVVELLIIIFIISFIIIHIFCVLWHFSGYCVFCSQCQCNWWPGKTLKQTVIYQCRCDELPAGFVLHSTNGITNKQMHHWITVT